MNNHKQKDCDEDDDVGRHPPKRQRRDENYRDNIINQRDNNGTKKCVDNRLGNDHSSKYTSVKDEDKQPLHKLIESLRYNLGTGNKCPVEVGYSLLYFVDAVIYYLSHFISIILQHQHL